MAAIVRDGKVYELTRTEVYDIYREIKRELLIEDIRSQMEQQEGNFDNVDIDYIADKAERAIDNDEYLWESYWQSIQYVLDKVGGADEL